MGELLDKKGTSAIPGLGFTREQCEDSNSRQGPQVAEPGTLVME